MNQMFVVGERPRLEVRIPSGRVDITSGPDGSVFVEIQGRGAEAIEVEQVGDTVTVRRDPGGGWSRGAARVTAVVPAAAHIAISVASADVDLRGDLGSASIKTASGDLQIDKVASLEVNTASGEVSASKVGGDVNISSASGDISLGEVRGRLTVKLASGDLVVDRVGGSVRCGSASGDLLIRRCEGEEVSVKSVSGDSSIGFPAGTRLDADCTSLSGTISFPAPTSQALVGERRVVRFSGRSVSGGIRVERC